MKEKANTDTTYCANPNCQNKCWRHRDKHEFEKDKMYIFQMYCAEWLEKNKKGIENK